MRLRVFVLPDRTLRLLSCLLPVVHSTTSIMTTSLDGGPSPDTAPTTSSKLQPDVGAETNPGTPESRIFESLKSFTADIQAIWPVLEALKNSPATTSADPQNGTPPQNNGNGIPTLGLVDNFAQVDDNRQKQVHDALQALEQVMDSHKKTGEALRELYIHLSAEVLRSELNEDLRHALRPISPDTEAGMLEAAAEQYCGHQYLVFRAATRVWKTFMNQHSAVAGEIANEAPEFDEAQLRRVLIAFELEEDGIVSLIRSTLHDVRYAFAGHGYLEPVSFKRRLSIPTMSQDDDPASQQVGFSDDGEQDQHTGANEDDDAEALWTSAESSPTRGVTDPSATVEPKDSIPESSNAKRRTQLRIRAGVITSADLPPVFDDWLSDSSDEEESFRFHPEFVPDEVSYFQQLEDRQTPYVQQAPVQTPDGTRNALIQASVGPSDASNQAPAGPPDCHAAHDNVPATTMPIVPDAAVPAEETIAKPAPGLPTLTPSQLSTPGLSNCPTSSSSCKSEKVGDSEDPATHDLAGQSTS